MVTGTGTTEITYLVIYQVFPGGLVGKNPSAKQETQETWVGLGREDPLEEEMATHSSLVGESQQATIRYAKSWTQLRD